ncbi:type I 3-dehydroquinate dehydratase, partial [Acidobacteria bacterium AH-259-D05]|nr:type I 3-dehydroquinate dehydratase [Acidobacteria bacterium AH-259-D05]
MIKLCLTLAESSADVLEQKISRYAGQVPYIETRLDYLTEPSVPKVPTHQGTDFIATCRPARQGGCYQGEEGNRLKLLQKATHSGFSWVDLEHDVAEDPPLPPSTQILRSYHCFDRFPEDLSALFQNLKEAGGDAIKVAVSISKTLHLTSLLKWLESLGKTTPFVVLGMGDLGQPSRLLGAFLGNCWTYVAEDVKSKVAPGQLTLEQAVKCYQLPSWTNAPSIYGLLGNPLAHSLSPLLHNHLFQHHKLEKIYLPFLLDDVEVWFKYIEQSLLPFSGFSVTLPFKTDVLKLVHLHESSVDSLNTLVKKDSTWEGLNTDYPGFLQALQSRLSLEGKTAIVLGNGGVAHTVVKALQDQGVQVTVAGRNGDRVARFAQLYGCRHTLFSNLPVSAHICVNATPVGQYPNTEDSPLREDQLDFEVVYDLVYSPEQTRLLNLAQAKGLKTISGMEMFIEQAALQFVSWSGLSPERQMMKEILRSA